MVLPAITYNGSDVSHQYGIKKLFWFGRSNCAEIDGNFMCDRGDWITNEGWEEQLRNFVSAARADENSKPLKEVLWIQMPNYYH